MKSMQHALVLELSACALAVMNAASWEPPLHEAPASPAPLEKAPMPQPNRTFAGTVVKQGGSYVLRDASGTVYQLGNAMRFQRFGGNTVTVTGTLIPQTNTIHVESIEGA